MFLYMWLCWFSYWERDSPFLYPLNLGSDTWFALANEALTTWYKQRLENCWYSRACPLLLLFGTLTPASCEWAQAGLLYAETHGPDPCVALPTAGNYQTREWGPLLLTDWKSMWKAGQHQDKQDQSVPAGLNQILTHRIVNKYTVVLSHLVLRRFVGQTQWYGCKTALERYQKEALQVLQLQQSTQGLICHNENELPSQIDGFPPLPWVTASWG